MIEKTKVAATNMLNAARTLEFKLPFLGDSGFVASNQNGNSRFIDGYLLAFPAGRLQAVRFTELPDGSWIRPRSINSKESYYWSRSLEENPDNPEVRRWFLESLESMVAMHLAMQEKGES